MFKRVRSSHSSKYPSAFTFAMSTSSHISITIIAQHKIPRFYATPDEKHTSEFVIPAV
jgi:hypothetical protein